MIPAYQPINTMNRQLSGRSVRGRLGLIFLVLLLPLLTTSCANLAKVRDYSIPRLITPLADADFNRLIAQLKPLTELQALRASRVMIRFLDSESYDRWRDADAILVLQRPDKIRLVVQIPVVKTRIAEMVSEANRFKVAIYSDQYKRFLTGTNDADYSEWRMKLGEKKQSALVNARPFHFTESLLMRPLHIGEPQFAYAVEEALNEEPDTSQGAKPGARLLRSFYVVSEVELPTGGNAGARVRRHFWFDRTDQLRLARQQLFDDSGTLLTEVLYSNYQKLNPNAPELWPSVIMVKRPHDGYSAQLTFSDEGFALNPTDLPAAAFVLENKEGLPETDLDKPQKPL